MDGEEPEPIFDADDRGKIQSNGDEDLPGADEFGEDEIGKAIEELEISIGQREREQLDFGRWNPNGNEHERDLHRRYLGHKERIERETRLLNGLRDRQ